MVNLAVIKKEYNEILQQLSDPELISSPGRFEEINKKRQQLEKIIEKDKEIEELKNKIKENQTIISAKEDQELISLAETELPQLAEKEKKLEEELKKLLNENGDNNKTKGSEVVILEIRAGAGGEEAALFAADLLKMYSKYAESQSWKKRILDLRPAELGGLKEVIFELSSKGGSASGGKNGDVFSKMKYEGGVHRVQRVPKTEKSGRVHTSTASVAVLPRPKKAQIKIKPEDLKTDFYRASGPGGQYVNKRETAVRITHIPTGLVVTSQTERNQLQNKENALSILEARLLEKKEIEESERAHGKRKAQIGKAKRAEKIRTYNFLQDRVTDHRIKKSWHKLEAILNGDLNPLIKAFQKSEKNGGN